MKGVFKINSFITLSSSSEDHSKITGIERGVQTKEESSMKKFCFFCRFKMFVLHILENMKYLV